MKPAYLVAGMVILGLLTGFGASQIQGEEYCESLEQDLEENDSVEGQVACFSPDEIGQEVSGEVEDVTDLRCVCHQSHEGSERTFAIRS